MLTASNDSSASHIRKVPLMDAGTLAGIWPFRLEKNAWCIRHTKSLAASWSASVVISHAQQQIKDHQADDRL